MSGRKIRVLSVMRNFLNRAGGCPGLDQFSVGLIIPTIKMTGDNTTLERIDRAEDAADFIPLSGDIDILSQVLEHRLLRRNQLSVLVGRHATRLHRRLLKLVHEGFLSVVRLPQQKHIYALARRGAVALVERGLASEDLLNRRLRTHELKPLFLRHEMMVVEVHIALTLASRKSPAQLVDWREGRGLYDSVTVADSQGAIRLPVRPDAFFTLEDSAGPEGPKRAHFFLEADRSTENHTRFEDKIRAYWHYIENGLHAKRYTIKGVRVLTIALTEARAKNLCALAASVLPGTAHKYFLFGTAADFSPQDSDPMQAKTCYSPRTVATLERHPLMPNRLQNKLAVL